MHVQSGGTVYFPPGTYLTGTITLKDNVTLHVGPNAKLLGSTSLADIRAWGVRRRGCRMISSFSTTVFSMLTGHTILR